MPWDKDNYLENFKSLDENVRNKAIEIANSMLDDGYSKSKAIPIAISQAKKTINKDGEE